MPERRDPRRGAPHREPAGPDRRAVLAAAALLPLAPRLARAAPGPAPWINVNLQGLEGGSAVPGREGTDYFAATPTDFGYLGPRTTGPARLPFLWERAQPEPGGPLDPTYVGQISAVADAAARAGRSVILDCHNYMHRAVGGTRRAVDGGDGTLTRQHLADLWARLAATFATHPGVFGYDLMNEPQGLGEGQDLAAIMQASLDGIDGVDRRKAVFVEGDAWSSAEHWVAANPRYPLRDVHDRVVYSAHCYPDPDGSGTHFDYAGLARAALPATVLVDRTQGFAGWCAAKGLRGHIGETNVGRDDPRWQVVLDLALAFWARRGLPVNLWLYGARFGANPFNLFPVDGVEAPQWAVVARRIAALREPAR